MNASHPAAFEPSRYEFQVANMDCAACANRVTGALGRLAGVSEVEVNFTTQKLRLRVDEALSSRATVERILSGLGYPAELQVGGPAQQSPLSGQLTAPPVWYRTFKGRLLITTGVLLLVSVLLAVVRPTLAPWGFA